jgi:hypothetical protein
MATAVAGVLQELSGGERQRKSRLPTEVRVAPVLRMVRREKRKKESSIRNARPGGDKFLLC